MDMETKLDKLDERVRELETSNVDLKSTLNHLTESFNTFIVKLDKREEVETSRFNKLTNIVYFGIGGLTLFQFLVSNGIIKVD